MYKPWSSTTAVPPPPLDRPVWVDLDRLYGEPDGATAVVADDPPPGGYLKASGRVPGLLKRWARAVDGRWFGCRPGLELTADRSAYRSFRRGRAARTSDGVLASRVASVRANLAGAPAGRRRGARRGGR
jgi:hypothetical protein